MTNLDQLKAKMANMDSQQLADLFDEVSDGDCSYCAFLSSQNCRSECSNCRSECSKGFKLWLDLELEECKECMCNKCPLSNSYKCDNCKDCLKKEKREIVKDCGCDRCIFRDKDCIGITCEEALRKSLEQEEGANND